MIFKKALYDPFKFSPHLNMNCSEQIAYTQHAAAVFILSLCQSRPNKDFLHLFLKTDTLVH